MRRVRVGQTRGHTLGVGIATDHVSAVCVAGDAITWAKVRSRTPDESLADALAALLRSVPRSRTRSPARSPWSRLAWPFPWRHAVVVAVGPAAVQVKRLVALPPLTDPTALSALVRENVQRFFLRNGVPLVTTGVRIVEPGVAWAAAFEAPVVEAVTHACRVVGLVAIRIVPTVVALPRVLTGTHATWPDGASGVALEFNAGVLGDVRRCEDPSIAPGASGGMVPALEAEGPRAAFIADAYAATQLAGGRRLRWVRTAATVAASVGPSAARTEPLTLRVRASRHHSAPSAPRMAIATGVCALLALWALLAGGVANARIARRAAATRSAHAAAIRAVQDSAAALARVTGTLQGLSAFDLARPRVTLLLAHLTRALPEGTALVALELDSAGTGTLVALSPDAQAVVDAVERVPGLASPRILGPVTPETDTAHPGGHTLERMSLRFQLLPALEPAQ